MGVKGSFKNEVRDISHIWKRIKKRDFSGNAGMAVKNSLYSFSTGIVTKGGSFFFSLVLARMLAPDYFGLYSLVLTTILLFSSVSELGIGTAMVTFASKALANNNRTKARSYFRHLLILRKRLLIGTALFVFLPVGYLLGAYYYQKPIFLALLPGVFYLLFSELFRYLNSAFQADNNYRVPLISETIFQILRVSIVFVAVLFFVNNLPMPVAAATLIGVLAFVNLVLFIFNLHMARKKITFWKEQPRTLTTKERKELWAFMWPVTFTVFSGIFFGYIDTIMLGHFVSIEYIAFYGIAWSLAGAIIAVLISLSEALLPFFSREKGKLLDQFFIRSRNLMILISISVSIIVFFLADYLVLLYGQKYALAILPFKWFSLLIPIISIANIYSGYYISKKQTKLVAKWLISTTVLNIILNYYFITYGLQFGMLQAILGATGATIITRITYLVGLVLNRKT